MKGRQKETHAFEAYPILRHTHMQLAPLRFQARREYLGSKGVRDWTRPGRIRWAQPVAQPVQIDDGFGSAAMRAGSKRPSARPGDSGSLGRRTGLCPGSTTSTSTSTTSAPSQSRQLGGAAGEERVAQSRAVSWQFDLLDQGFARTFRKFEVRANQLRGFRSPRHRGLRLGTWRRIHLWPPGSSRRPASFWCPELSARSAAAS